MSSLTILERKPLEKLFNMPGGYVLDFNDRTFGEFVHEVAELDIHSPAYSTNGTSKANKLRTLWKQESDVVVGRLLNALIDYALSPENKPSPEAMSLEERCRQIAQRLLNIQSVPVRAVTPSIFISYRREDAGAEARLLYDSLSKSFGPGEVFMDVASIVPGTQWPVEIQTNLHASSTVVVVVGSNWLLAGRDEWGKRRIDDQSDWVRRELEDALKLKKRVIPILVKGARVPPAEALPPTLRDLFNHQCIELRRDYWSHDIKILDAALSIQVSPATAVNQQITQQSSQPTDIKRRRDVEKLKQVFHWISLGAMDRFLYHLDYHGWLTNEGQFLWERLGWLIESSHFYLSDQDLRSRLISFMTAWGKCFTHLGEHMDQHRNGQVYFFNVHDGDEGKYVREQNQRAKFNAEQAKPLKAAFNSFLDYVRENYVEIEPETCGQDALTEYKKEENQLKKMIKLQSEYEAAFSKDAKQP